MGDCICGHPPGQHRLSANTLDRCCTPILSGLIGTHANLVGGVGPLVIGRAEARTASCCY